MDRAKEWNWDNEEKSVISKGAAITMIREILKRNTTIPQEIW